MIPSGKFNIVEYANSAQLIYRPNEIIITIQAYLYANWQIVSKSYVETQKT